MCVDSTDTAFAQQLLSLETFKYKGNEEQYQHQEKVASHIDSAVDALHSGKLVEAANALEEAHASCVTGLAFSGEVAGDQSIQPLVPATMPSLGSVPWSNYQRNLPTCRLQAKEPLSESVGLTIFFLGYEKSQNLT
ncbi:uncharacterized protein [Montipora capricornis]|uniref:uncharacterized protein n=1 Tax=Montipora capricornis TaxID=246305 RepID=UPI0035F17807